MESFWLSFGIVMPMFLLLLTGWLIRYFRVIGDSGFDALNTLCFKLLLPMSLFCNIYNGGDLGLLDARMLIWALVCQVLILLLLFLTVPRVFSENPVRASIIQACFRSNFITFGIVIAGALGSPEELMVVSVLAGLLIPLYNIGGVGILEYYRGGRLSMGRMGKQIIRNPFVISCLLALLCVGLGLRLPQFIETTAKNLAACATPISFLALGGCLDLKSVEHYKKEISWGVGYRLIVQPGIFLGLSFLLGFRGTEFLALMAMLISPTAVATYNMARGMDADGELAGYLVVFQSIGSMVTIFAWICLLSGMKLI